MRPLPLIVHVQDQEHAACIPDDLAEWGTSIEQNGNASWDVHVERFKLELDDGTPAEPATFVAAVPS